MRMGLMAGIGSAALAAGVLGACGSVNDQTRVTAGSDAQASTEPLPQGSEPVNLNPDDFTTEIDNEFWPMAVGSRWIYEETQGSGPAQRVVVTVTSETKRIANGIEARVVHDVVSENGEPVEITDDWYAQDAEGNVWYLGERTGEYENGKLVTRAGSFEAGVDGAQPGIIMPADPQPGMAYRQEYYEGEAEDKAVVLSLGEMAQVSAGFYERTLMTKDLVPLEPKVQELKFYAPGVGPVLTLDSSGGNGREELVGFKSG
jgi:hypothetical protein